MKYFTLLQRGYNPKNKLEEAAQKLAANRTNLLVEDTDLQQFADDIKSRVKALNEYFSRCKPLEFSHSSCPSGKGDRVMNCSSVFTIHLHVVKNS